MIPNLSLPEKILPLLFQSQDLLPENPPFFWDFTVLLSFYKKLVDAASLVAQWLKKKKKKTPAYAGDTGSVPDPGRSHLRRSN